MKGNRHPVLARLVAALGAATLCLGALPAQVSAVGYSISAVTLSTRCDYGDSTHWVWKGSNDYVYSTNQNTGNFDFCYQLVKVGVPVYNSSGSLTAVNGADQDGYEYYIFTTTTRFRTTKDYGYSGNRARLRFTVNTASYLKDYSDSIGSPWAVSCWNVGSSVSIPFSGGAFSGGLSLSHTFCNGTGLSLDSYSATGATWSTPDVRNAPKFENAMVAKFKKGTRPTFAAYLDYPWYSTYIKETRCYGSSCANIYWPTYGYRTDPWVVTAKF